MAGAAADQFRQGREAVQVTVFKFAKCADEMSFS
jgi:hypothetical protein